MAAAASLSPEDLLPKGGAGKAEELEDELEEEEEDDEEVSGLGGGEGGEGAVTPRGAQGRAARPDMVVPPAAGRDAGGAAVGTHGDVPGERPIGGRGYIRPVANGSAEDVQVRGRRAGRSPRSGLGGHGGGAGRLPRLSRWLWPLVAQCGACGERQSHGFCLWMAWEGRG